VYLYVENGRAEIRDATFLWGKDTNETEDALKQIHGPKTQVASIGQAGERLSLIAGIINDYGRAWGRSGGGAVMGSKNLKAIAVNGTLEVPMFDKAAAEELRKKHVKEPMGRYHFFKTTGTTGSIGPLIVNGDSAVRNWGGTIADIPDGPEQFDVDRVMSYVTKKYGCWRCTMACGGHMEVKEEGPYHGTKHHKVEYETGWAFGTLTGNTNFPSLIKANELCNRYGLDTISAGSVIAFAVELSERGILSPEETDGIPLRWGDHEAIIAMLHKVGRVEGFGAILAQGVQRAAEIIGRGAEDYAIHVGGQEVPGHTPLFIPGLAVSYVMDATPARHTQGREGLIPPGYDLPKHDKYQFFGPERVKAHKILRDWVHVVNAAGVCLFGYVSYHYSFIPDFLRTVCGWDWSVEEMLKAGDRIANIRHAFNLREGINPLTFRMPGRVVGDPPFKDGNVANITVPYREMIREYCEIAEWDPETAMPSRKKLEELGLHDVAEDLYAAASR